MRSTMTDQERQSREDFNNRLTWQQEGNVMFGYTDYAKQSVSHYDRWGDVVNVICMKVEHMVWFDYLMDVYPKGKMIDYDLDPRLAAPPKLTVTLKHEPNHFDRLCLKFEIYPTGLAYEFIFGVEDISMAYNRRLLFWLPEMIEKECERFIRHITIGNITEKYEAFVAAQSAPKVYTPDRVLDKLKYWRHKSKLSLRQVEKETGISNAYLSQLENGKISSPSFDYISRLLKLYNIKINF